MIMHSICSCTYDKFLRYYASTITINDDLCMYRVELLRYVDLRVKLIYVGNTASSSFLKSSAQRVAIREVIQDGVPRLVFTLLNFNAQLARSVCKVTDVPANDV